MVPESFFEWCFRSTNISLSFILGFIRELCFIHSIWCKTFIAQRTFIFNLVIASKIFFIRVRNLFVVWQYNRSYVSHTTITYFNRITVEYFMHRISLWKRHCDSFRKVLTTSAFTFMEEDGLNDIVLRLDCSYSFFFNYILIRMLTTLQQL